MAALQRERLDDGIEVVRLDRPQARNALDSAALSELEAALCELAADEELRVLVVSTTSTRALCAGADVAEVLDRAGGIARMEAFARVYAAVEAFPAPTVCVCVGNVVGAGAEIAAGCDLRIGADNLRLAWAGARLGVPVGPARLTPLVGLAAHPPEGMRRLKAMFRELTGAAGHVARENELLVEWQRTGAGLPPGGLRR